MDLPKSLSSLSITDVFERHVFPHLTVESVCPGVEFSRRAGRFWHSDEGGTTPDRVAGGFSIDTQTLRWSDRRDGQPRGRSVLALLNGGEFPLPGRGEYRQAIERAASAIRLELPDLPDPDRAEEEAAYRAERAACLMETFFLITREFLMEEIASTNRQSLSLEFLRRKGFESRQLEGVSMGLFVDPGEMMERLSAAGFSQREIADSKLLADARLPGRIVGPIRDVSQRIVNFWARHPEDRPPKFLFLRGEWKESLGAFGLDSALRPQARGSEGLILVEGIFDAMLLHCRGIHNVAAIGGTPREMTGARWRRLKELGVKRVSLLPDRRDEGDRCMVAAVEQWLRADSAPTLFLVPPHHLQDVSTPGLLIRSRGPSAVADLLDASRWHAYRYQVYLLMRKHRGDEAEWSEPARQRALQDGIAFYVWRVLADRDDVEMYFVPPLLAGLGLSRERFEGFLMAARPHLPDTVRLANLRGETSATTIGSNGHAKDEHSSNGRTQSAPAPPTDDPPAPVDEPVEVGPADVGPIEEPQPTPPPVATTAASRSDLPPASWEVLQRLAEAGIHLVDVWICWDTPEQVTVKLETRVDDVDDSHRRLILRGTNIGRLVMRGGQDGASSAGEQSDDDANQPAADEPPPVVAPAEQQRSVAPPSDEDVAARSRRTIGRLRWCELHRCYETHCFCFD